MLYYVTVVFKIAIKWNVFRFRCIKSIYLFSSSSTGHHCDFFLSLFFRPFENLCTCSVKWFSVCVCVFMPKFILKFYCYYRWITPDCFNPYGSIIIVSTFSCMLNVTQRNIDRYRKVASKCVRPTHSLTLPRHYIHYIDRIIAILLINQSNRIALDNTHIEVCLPLSAYTLWPELSEWV